MKPKIDFDDPLIASIAEFYQERAELATVAGAQLEDSVRPIYVAPPPKFVPQQTGSCVLIRLLDDFFIFSASHVFEDLGDYPPLVSCGEKLQPLPGERFSRSRGPSGTHRDDPIDASVFHLQGEIPDDIRESALTIESMDLEGGSGNLSPHVAIGYRANQSKFLNGSYNSKREIYPTVEFPDRVYEQTKIDRRTHLALAFEKQVYVRGNWQLSPSPKGMSGGGLFRIEGLAFDPLSPPGDNCDAKLSAIIIEFRPERHGKPAALVGCKIAIHLGLVHQYLPDIIEQLDLKDDR